VSIDPETTHGQPCGWPGGTHQRPSRVKRCWSDFDPDPDPDSDFDLDTILSCAFFSIGGLNSHFVLYPDYLFYISTVSMEK